MTPVNFTFEGKKEDYYIPKHATEGSSGADLRNAEGGDVIIMPHRSAMISTGIIAEIPEGCEGQLRPRSGIAVKKTAIMLPSIGTIDSDYRGVISVCYYNPTPHVIIIERGERIAQLVIAPYVKCLYKNKETLTETERGSGGFGSTGQ